MFYNVFLTFEPTFCMMSCLTLQSQPWAPLCFVCESAHRLRDLLSSLQICKRVVHDILKKLLSICETVVTFLCAHCPNCRTVVSLGRFLWAATLKPPNPYFGAWLWSLTFLYTFSLTTCHFRSPGGSNKAFWNSLDVSGLPGRSRALQATSDQEFLY